MCSVLYRTITEGYHTGMKLTGLRCAMPKNNVPKTYFQTKQSIDGLYFARPDVTWKFAFAVCFGTGILITTPSANIFAPNTLFTWMKHANSNVWCVAYKSMHDKIRWLTLTFTSMRVLPNSLIVGSTLNGRFTPSVIRYLW